MTNVTDPTETDLLPLFQKWADLEPDLCRVDTYNETIRDEEGELTTVLQSDIHLKLGDGWTTVWASGISEIHSVGLAIGQASLQEAIAAKGWKLWTELVQKPSLSWEAMIQTDKDKRVLVANSNPAIALLAAYMQALEAA